MQNYQEQTWLADNDTTQAKERIEQLDVKVGDPCDEIVIENASRRISIASLEEIFMSTGRAELNNKQLYERNFQNKHF